MKPLSSGEGGGCWCGGSLLGAVGGAVSGILPAAKGAGLEGQCEGLEAGWGHGVLPPWRAVACCVRELHEAGARWDLSRPYPRRGLRQRPLPAG